MASMEHLHLLLALAVLPTLYWLFSPRPSTRNRKRKATLKPGAHQSVAWTKEQTGANTSKQYLVIGTGFLGQRLTRRLLARGETRVRAFDISALSPFSEDESVEYYRGDVTKLEELNAAMQGVDVVFSTFAVIMFHQRMAFQAPTSINVNINGTDNVISAMQANGVPLLIHTSSSNVCVDPILCSYDGARGKHLDETAALTTRETCHNHYGWTKAVAEKRVLAANSASLRTVSIRPCSLIFGHDDRFSIQRILEGGKAEILFPDAETDVVYVDNVVYAHLLAEEKLGGNVKGVAGEVFNVTNEDPMRSEDFQLLIKAHCPQLKCNYLPLYLLYVLAHCVELMQWVSRDKAGKYLGLLDKLTPAALTISGLTYTFNGQKARERLGYAPIFSVEQGIQRSIQLFKENERKQHRRRKAD